MRGAEDLLDLAQARQLDASVLVEGDDPHVWRVLCGRSPAGVRQVDAWMARPLAADSGALPDPGVRAATWEALPQRVTAHALLLQALANGTGGSANEDLPFVGALAEAASEATEANRRNAAPGVG
ncbi:hypothetical protein [Streptomyces chartreusis]|uniref:hypothetical protein n=1 Tax=Streptomyces chartreusis TaxID=1969 RepID=UPI0033B7AA71